MQENHTVQAAARPARKEGRGDSAGKPRSHRRVRAKPADEGRDRPVRRGPGLATDNFHAATPGAAPRRRKIRNSLFYNSFCLIHPDGARPTVVHFPTTGVRHRTPHPGVGLTAGRSP